MGDGEASYVRPDNAASTSQSVLQETTQPSTNASDGLSDQRPVSYTHLTLPTICSV